LAPTIKNLPTGAEAAVSILPTEAGDSALDDASGRKPIAAQALGAPFSFWQVAVYLQDVPSAMKRLDLRTTLWLWLVSILVLIILVGAYMFILRAHREARLSRAQTTFVSKVTHELRTPLSSIKMFAELLEMRIADMPRHTDSALFKHAEQYLGIIRHECDRLGRLINRVIDFSRLEQRVHPYHFDYHDVTDIVTRVVESFRPYAEARGFDLRMTAETSMPRVRLDADALAQVLLNFLDNAVQFSDEVKELRVRLHKEPGAVAIDVSDRGVGIEPKEMNRLFDKFYTSHGRLGAKRPGGLGLGLSLSREIVREHGGEIRVRSEVGEGSTFTVVLPVTIVDFIRVRPDAVAGHLDAGLQAGQPK
jgi:two-component system phosphate regulon sensor histidine kinase PhoR